MEINRKELNSSGQYTIIIKKSCVNNLNYSIDK